MKYLFKTVLLIHLVSCQFFSNDSASTEKNEWDSHVPFVTNYDVFFMPVSDKYHSYPDSIGSVNLSEASGLAMSNTNNGFIWSHNDSGHTHALYLIDAATGEITATYMVEGTHNIDWEDMEVLLDRDDSVSYIYIADTGDNDRKRPEYYIYRFPEPAFVEEHRNQLIRVSHLNVERIRFQYPDGNHNTESIMVDPQTKDIYLITKSGEFSMAYVAPYPQLINEQFTLTHAGTFSFRQASAANTSFDGQRVVIKNRQEIFYWERMSNERFIQMLAREPVKLPYIGEPQGEAICFDKHYNYFTLSEAMNASLKPILFKYFIKD